MKILIIRFMRIGDCVLASPILEALHERYPDSHLTWAVQSKTASMIEGLPHLDEVFLWDNSQRRVKTLIQNMWRTRRARFDIVLDLNGANAYKAGYLMMASGAKCRIAGTNSHPLARRSSTEQVLDGPRQTTHMRDFYFNRAAPLDIAPDAAQRFFPHIPLNEENRRFARGFLAQASFGDQNRIVCLNLGAFVERKRWKPERFAQLAHAILCEDDTARIIISGAPDDIQLKQRFEAETERLNWQKTEGNINSNDANWWRYRVLDAVGHANLLQLAALAEHCAAFVTGDTGPMHIAAAVGAPIVALFGPTPIARAYPVKKPDGASVRVLDGQALAGREDAPMETHTVEHVLHEVRALLQEWKPRARHR